MNRLQITWLSNSYRKETEAIPQNKTLKLFRLFFYHKNLLNFSDNFLSHIHQPLNVRFRKASGVRTTRSRPTLRGLPAGCRFRSAARDAPTNRKASADPSTRLQINHRASESRSMKSGEVNAGGQLHVRVSGTTSQQPQTTRRSWRKNNSRVSKTKWPSKFRAVSYVMNPDTVHSDGGDGNAAFPDRVAACGALIVAPPSSIAKFLRHPQLILN